MKASEALRKGMKKVKGKIMKDYYHEGTDCACALGCIFLGYGVDKSTLKCGTMDFSITLEAEMKYLRHYGNTVIEDNDYTSLSLEDIAQKLEAIGE